MQQGRAIKAVKGYGFKGTYGGHCGGGQDSEEMCAEHIRHKNCGLMARAISGSHNYPWKAIHNGESFAYIAAGYGKSTRSFDCLEFILQSLWRYQSPDLKSDGRTLLMHAAVHGDQRTLEVILSDLDAGSTGTNKKFVTVGETLSFTDDDGKTALELASNEQVRTMLLDAQKRNDSKVAKVQAKVQKEKAGKQKVKLAKAIQKKKKDDDAAKTKAAAQSAARAARAMR